MSQPSFAEYTEALRPGLAAVLSDPLLARGQLLMRGPGLPTVYGGNFALTFVVEVDDRRYAVRCFHKPTDGLQQRYEAIGRHLRSISSPYFVEFEFQPSGITTESGVHPVVRMDWADGPTLGAFVAEHRADASTLQELRDSLRRLAANLDVCGIAHGDIQPSNIIVESPTRLKLIDYDGMFVPALHSMVSAEIGQRNFQHPGRQECHFDADLDAFSFAVLDVALDALSKRPDLWEATDSSEDAFIFHSQDFADPARSPTFRALVQLPRLEQRVRNLAAVCASPFERIPSFGDFLAGRNIPEVSVVFSGDPILTMPRRYLSPHPVVDAANFARCCSHVGDRVELIGRVFRVARSHTARFEATYLRVEFGERGQDMSCLKIWPDAESRLDDVPDAAWVGQWVSAVGLVEPVARGHSGAQRQRDVSISINERSQLQRITEAEARLRLRGRDARTRPAPDGAEGIRTDPVMTDRAPRLRAVTTRRPHGGTRPALVRTRRGASPEPAPADAVPAEAPALPEAPQRTESFEARPAPVAPTPAPVAPPPVAPRPLSPRTPAVASGSYAGPARRRPRTAWFAGAVIVGLAVAAFLATRSPHEPETAADLSSKTAPAETGLERSAESTSTATPAPRVPTDELAVQLELQQSLRGVRLPIETRAGSLSIGKEAGASGKQVLMLDATPVAGLRDDEIVLAHRAEYTDREVIVGFTQCAGATPPCGVRKPFWVVLRAGQPPVTRLAPELWASSTAGVVTARDTGVRVDLGVWNGERRATTLTHAGDLETARQRAPIAALNRADCALVAESLESCAASANCQSFASSARPIPRRIWARLNRIYHETTGLDAAAYRKLCVRSCEFGLTPSAQFIRQSTCNGAQRGQWATENPAAGLLGERG